MKTKITSILFISATLLSGASQATPTGLPAYMELALVDICKASLTNRKHELVQAIKASHLDTSMITNKLVCNGLPVAEFAETHNANKTSAYLRNSVDKGNVGIVDIAQVKDDNFYIKLDV